ncbi:MAG TPA: SigE family RNA polymerase sigma factor [Trebonia sp.]|nr:SigE family RNA polymerase sigma factor [Trebonia sp.]
MQLPTEKLRASLEDSQRVSVLYQTHALALVKLAFLMTGDQPTAEDVVQDAFLGLTRRWRSLQDQDNALGYLRASVLNGCRSVHRVRFRRQGITLEAPPDTASAEDLAILGEVNSQVLVAIRRLPARQREAVVLRYYLDMTEDQAARAMGVSRGTVKSATSRGLAALARMLKETK